MSQCVCKTGPHTQATDFEAISMSSVAVWEFIWLSPAPWGSLSWGRWTGDDGEETFEMDFELEMNLFFNKRGNCYRSGGEAERVEEKGALCLFSQTADIPSSQ